MATEMKKSRVMQKTDTEANWNKAINFIPLKGEIIIYSPDYNNTLPRFKIGNGITKLNLLPFYSYLNVEYIGTDNMYGINLADGVTYNNGLYRFETMDSTNYTLSILLNPSLMNKDSSFFVSGKARGDTGWNLITGYYDENGQFNNVDVYFYGDYCQNGQFILDTTTKWDMCQISILWAGTKYIGLIQYNPLPYQEDFLYCLTTLMTHSIGGGEDISDAELITIEDIDEICGGTIIASSEVKF